MLIFITIAFLLFSKTSEITPTPWGDGVEYALMSESFLNHLSFDLQKNDALGLCKSIAIAEQTDNFYKAQYYNSFVYNHSYFQSENGLYYCYHFWAYSLVNVPAHAFCKLFNIHPLYSFIITNIILVLLVIYYLFFLAFGYTLFQRISFSLIFLYSSLFWYLTWLHTEVFSSSLVFLSILLFFDKRYYWSLLCASISAMHNQPIFLLSIFIIIKLLYVYRFKLSNLIKIFVCSFWVIIPPLFYFILFGKPNLIIANGYIDVTWITWTRFWGIFLDLDQGMILSIPLLLVIVIIAWVKEIVQIKKWKYELFLFFVLIGMTFFYMPMVNWNHGCAIINRYFVWSSMIIVALFIWFFKRKSIVNYILITVVLITQIMAIVQQGGLTINDWETDKHTSIATWMLENYPDYYNPDPMVFIMRSKSKTKNLAITKYYNEEHAITKILVKKENINELEKIGFTKKEINKLLPSLSFINNYAYVNIKDIPLRIKLNCLENIYSNDMEHLGLSSSDTLYANTKIVVYKQYTINNSIAFSGNQSVASNPTMQYLFTSSLAVNENEMYEISVWVNGNDKEGVICACDEAGANEFYASSVDVVETFGDWEKLKLTLVIPKLKSRLRVYLWNMGTDTIYFDNFSIIKINN